jgi:hypothetical protein
MKRKLVFYSLLCLLLPLGISGLVANSHARVNAAHQTDAATPDVLVLAPDAATLRVNDEVLSFRVLVLSPMTPLTSVTMVINGSTKRLKLDGEVDATRRRFLNQEEIVLKPGENVISISATNEKASSRPVIRKVIYEPQVARKPNLVLLAIGISDYRESDLDRRHANADATAFGKLLSKVNEQGLYAKVKPLILSDAEATRLAIFKGLDWLNSEATSDNDIRVLFLGGAFGVDYQDNIYFLSSEHKPKTPLEIANVNYVAFLEKLAQKPGPVFIFVGSGPKGRRNLFDITRKYSYGGNFYVYTVDEDQSFVAPANLVNSAFTTALLEGLSGRADVEINGRRDGVIDSLELQLWLSRRVPELSDNRQTPAFFGSSKPIAFFKPAATQP